MYVYEYFVGIVVGIVSYCRVFSCVFYIYIEIVLWLKIPFIFLNVNGDV
jgi:hypothetical protein